MRFCHYHNLLLSQFLAEFPEYTVGSHAAKILSHPDLTHANIFTLYIFVNLVCILTCLQLWERNLLWGCCQCGCLEAPSSFAEPDLGSCWVSCQDMGRGRARSICKLYINFNYQMSANYTKNIYWRVVLLAELDVDHITNRFRQEKHLGRRDNTMQTAFIVPK